MKRYAKTALRQGKVHLTTACGMTQESLAHAEPNLIAVCHQIFGKIERVYAKNQPER
jgi:hypothetical protein